MPLPFIPIALGVVALGSAIFGGVKAVEASSDSDEADNTNERAQDVFDAAKRKLERERKRCSRKLDELGHLKARIWSREIGRAVSLIELFRDVRLEGGPGGDALGDRTFTEAEMTEMKTVSAHAGEIVDGIERGAIAVGSGALVGLASYGGVAALGTASTGTAIGALSGVAATNATLAWFGGGSLAAGGFGMAGGIAVLGSFAAASVLAVAGWMWSEKAREKLAHARISLAHAEKAASEMRAAASVARGISKVADESESVLQQLRRRASPVLDDLADVARRNRGVRAHVSRFLTLAASRLDPTGFYQDDSGIVRSRDTHIPATGGGALEGNDGEDSQPSGERARRVRLRARVARELYRLGALTRRRSIDYSNLSDEDRRKAHLATMFLKTLKIVVDEPLITKKGSLAKDHVKALREGRKLLEDKI